MSGNLIGRGASTIWKYAYGSYESPVIFLTGKDLYFEYALTGGDEARYTFNDSDTLNEFASASQRLNLGLHEAPTLD
jgi:hypothetical protein